MNITNIGIFGRRNAGKSSLINILLGQDFAIVSDNPGTTTDPIEKRMEIFGVGPCKLIDTAGIDDSGLLGEKRVAKTKEILDRIDIAIVLFTANIFGKPERELMEKLKKKAVPVILVHNQSDIVALDSGVAVELTGQYGVDVLEYSCCHIEEEVQKEAKESLIALIVKAASISSYREKAVFDGILPDNCINESTSEVVLVCPIDSEAPEGRLILPQVMSIRDLLDKNATAIVLGPQKLANYLKTHPSPLLVVTDSQVFAQVAQIVPDSIPLTSFSMLLARSKGCFEDYIKGTSTISGLKDGDRVLILESCTHHSSCEDIGRVKLPALFKKFTGKQLEFDIVAGLDKITSDMSEYALVVQCGGCMITGRQLYQRLSPALEKGVPVSNYGMAIAYMSGIFDRALSALRDLSTWK